MTEQVGGPAYPIRAVAKLTGISIDTLRAWERRYAAVTPARTERGRMYTDADVMRLRAIRDAVAAGHSVGQVAALTPEELRTLARKPDVGPVAARGRVTTIPPHDTSRLRDALLRLDSAALDVEVSHLAAVLAPDDLIRSVVLPLARDVGEQWNERRGGIAHEHMISATLRHLLGAFLRLHGRATVPTRLLFATPAGDRHELGILAAAMLAASHGFEVSYVGPDLPAGEIVHAVRVSGAHVLVLATTVRGEGERQHELRDIAGELPRTVELWLGGAAAADHAAGLGSRVLVLPDFDAYLLQLQRLTGRTA